MASELEFDSQDSLMQNLTCSLCLDLFKEPKSMPNCSHTYCLECLKQLHVERRGPSSFVKCPQCRADNFFASNVTSVQGFNTNVVVKSVVESLSAKRKNLQPVGGNSSCAHQKEPIWLRCKHCDGKYCEPCGVVHKEKLKKAAIEAVTQVVKEYDDKSPRKRNEILGKIDGRASDAINAIRSIHDRLSESFNKALFLRAAKLVEEIETAARQEKFAASLMTEAFADPTVVSVIQSQIEHIKGTSVLDLDDAVLIDFHNQISRFQIAVNELNARQPAEMAVTDNSAVTMENIISELDRFCEIKIGSPGFDLGFLKNQQGVKMNQEETENKRTRLNIEVKSTNLGFAVSFMVPMTYLEIEGLKKVVSHPDPNTFVALYNKSHVNVLVFQGGVIRTACKYEFTGPFMDVDNIFALKNGFMYSVSKAQNEKISRGIGYFRASSGQSPHVNSITWLSENPTAFSHFLASDDWPGFAFSFYNSKLAAIDLRKDRKKNYTFPCDDFPRLRLQSVVASSPVKVSILCSYERGLAECVFSKRTNDGTEVITCQCVHLFNISDVDSQVVSLGADRLAIAKRHRILKIAYPSKNPSVAGSYCLKTVTNRDFGGDIAISSLAVNTVLMPNLVDKEVAAMVVKCGDGKCRLIFESFPDNT